MKTIRRDGTDALSSGAFDRFTPILAIHDSDVARAAGFRTILADLPASIVEVGSAHDWSASIPSSSRGLALIALEEGALAGSGGLSAIREFRSRGFSVLVHADGARRWDVRERCLPFIAGAAQLLDSGAAEFSQELRREAGRLLEKVAEELAEERKVRSTLAELGVAGESKCTLDLYRMVLKFGLLSDLPALVAGETGTGKEQVARALHRLDPKRAKGPFLPVNCAALSATLAESELFGHRKGAFTGADRDRRGLFKAASGGVLFLDEIGELPEALQGKLLRVLQDGKILTVGEEREETVDVRLVAATNRDLGEQVRRGRFRIDLLHRLNVLQLNLTPLRERREDIGPLVDFFLVKHAGASGRARVTVAPEVITALRRLELPGNVRQLENIITRALGTHDTADPLQLCDLPPEVWQEVAEKRELAPSAPDWNPQSEQEWEMRMRPQFEQLIGLTRGRLRPALESCEKIIISVISKQTRGNQSEMARVLNVTARSVYNKLRRYKLRGGSGDVSL